MAVSIKVIRMQGLFEPRNVVGCKGTGSLDGRGSVPGTTCIDHEGHISESLPRGGDEFLIEGGIGAHRTPSILHETITGIDETRRRWAHLFRSIRPEDTRIGRNPVCRIRPQQSPHRDSGDLASQIPQGHVHTTHGVPRNSAGSVPRGALDHGRVDAGGIIDLHPRDDGRQSVSERCRPGRLDHGAGHIAARYDLTQAGRSIFGVETDQQNVLCAVSDFSHFGQSQMDCFNTVNFHRAACSS